MIGLQQSLSIYMQLRIILFPCVFACQILNTTEECIWNVFYSLQPLPDRSSLRLHYKTSQNSCKCDGFSLELLRIARPNVTTCNDLDHLLTVMINETKEDRFIFTNLVSGRYCVGIEALGSECKECDPAMTRRPVLLLSGKDNGNHKPKTQMSLPTSIKRFNTTVLFIAVSGTVVVLLMVLTATYFFGHRYPHAADLTEVEDAKTEGDCNCHWEKEVFLLHTQDVTYQATKLSKCMQPFFQTSTLLMELHLSQIAIDWITERLKRGKVVLIESGGAQKIYHNRAERVRKIPTAMQRDDNMSYMDLVFCDGLAAIRGLNLDRDFDRLYVVRLSPAQTFPAVSVQRQMQDIVGSKRYQLPETFPELCRDLSDHTQCTSCMNKWSGIADSLQFKLEMQI